MGDMQRIFYFHVASAWLAAFTPPYLTLLRQRTRLERTANVLAHPRARMEE
jgi:hypothetical protein